uniref:Acyl-protein thioesterase n=1 Tax=Solanum tuberosum TaxID=4113 RepID=M1D7B7_SOLTU
MPLNMKLDLNLNGIQMVLVSGDDVVAYQHGEKSARILSSSGFQNLTLRTYEGLGHYTIPEETDEICRWLSANLCLGGT